MDYINDQGSTARVMLRLPQSKRLRITVAGLVSNFVAVGFGIYHQADLQALGVCIALINAPLYAYILGQLLGYYGYCRS